SRLTAYSVTASTDLIGISIGQRSATEKPVILPRPAGARSAMGGRNRAGPARLPIEVHAAQRADPMTSAVHQLTRPLFPARFGRNRARPRNQPTREKQFDALECNVISRIAAVIRLD